MHLSFAHQLEGTLGAHFGSVDQLWLFELEARELGDELRLEVSRGGEAFPHLYREVSAAELARRWRLARRAGGWALPRLGARPAEDRPPGETPPFGGGP